jgi:hypothetical protein
MQADGIMDAGYQNTVSGLLHKRGEMLASMADLREQIAVLSNDLESIERVMETPGYEGDLRPRRPAFLAWCCFTPNRLGAFAT